MKLQRSIWVRKAVCLVALLGLLALAACGGDSSSSDTTSPSGGDAAKKVRVAAFGIAGATYWSASMAEIKSVVQKEGGTVQEFLTPYDPAKQFRQIQDATASGKFDAFVISALDGVSIAPAIKQAVDKGIKVVGISTIVGSDQGTFKAQVPGMSGAIVDPPVQRGQWLGGLVTRACEGLSTCKVVLAPGSTQVPIEKLFMSEAEKVMSKTPGIEVVATVSSGLQAGPAAKATAEVLQAHPDVNVIASDSDQAIVGSVIALKQAGKSVGTGDGDVRVVGLGASKVGVEGTRAGTWFGTVLALPGDEGRIGAETAIKAARGQLDAPVEQSAAADSGIPPELTKADLPADFQAQWTG